MTPAPPISGLCDERFAGVREALATSLASGADLGAGVTVICDNKPVVDLRGGYKSKRRDDLFDDTLVCVFSSGKAVVAALVMAAVDQGLMHYDEPIATYWPAFGDHGKEQITLGDALSHQSGLAAFMEPIDPALWLDWDGLCARLAHEAPLWPPSAGQSGYHPQTYGFIVGEPMRRATGKTIGQHLSALGLDVHCGLTDAQADRVGPMVKPSSPPNLGEITPLRRAAFLERWSSPMGVSRTDWMAAEIPASNMHATSTGLAQVMQAFASGTLGTQTISDATRSEAVAQRCRGDDLVLPFDISFAAGVMRNVDGQYGPSPTAVGHYGFGGSCVVADPAHRLSFAYVPNKMSAHLVKDPRALSLLEAVYDAV
ncbi:MAG: serine hydrolase domain-containing protein [Parvularcula sp.]